jgi:dTDP-4-dehydrorhamnose 3,5-epimerase
VRILDAGLEDACLIESDRHEDDRGYFSRLRCSREFEAHGLPGHFVQTNLSYNQHAGTFRGLHFQLPPSQEGKLVRCLAGSIVDVILDLRPDSATYLKHKWFELDDQNVRALYVPTGFAHGFLTRADDSVVLYEMTDFYAPDLQCGLRWDDPALDIRIPGDVANIHPRDAAYPELDESSLKVFERRGR